ncbi:hypothetical protein AWB66_06005 [Caballeronia telluris]|uniref:Uncharacterized protein n=1 Tax=Caballeronia telluris TaxID=326475 RepID=A0A158KF91_9BURK|nr:hypothetical protein AWB66_06005 [Caballeronia telluris]
MLGRRIRPPLALNSAAGHSGLNRPQPDVETAQPWLSTHARAQPRPASSASVSASKWPGTPNAISYVRAALAAAGGFEEMRNGHRARHRGVPRIHIASRSFPRIHCMLASKKFSRLTKAWVAPHFRVKQAVHVGRPEINALSSSMSNGLARIGTSNRSARSSSSAYPVISATFCAGHDRRTLSTKSIPFNRPGM